MRFIKTSRPILKVEWSFNMSKIVTQADHPIHIHELGCQPYSDIYHLMQEFTRHRQAGTPDELWILEHFPVYTQGVSCRDTPLPGQSPIPVVATDRGGQITYHGPGQLISYCLLDLKARHLNIRQLVCRLEQALIHLLAEFNILAGRRENAPGVYVNEKKIASLGLRVKRGYTYHGIALNVDMDLQPFESIHPCGIQKLKMTQIKDELPHDFINVTMSEVHRLWIKHFLEQMS